MTENTDIRQRLWKSLEMRCIRWDLIFLLVFSALLVLVEYKGVSKEIMVIISGVISAPYLWRILLIFHKPDGYVFHQTTLSQFQRNFPLKMIYATVVLEAPDGSKIIKNTFPIFVRRGMVGPLMEDYVNRDVTIAYNETTQVVVVIG